MSGLHHFLRIEMTGAIDPAAQEWLVAGLANWRRSGFAGAMLPRCLGLPCTASKMRQAIRDHWLRVAADQYGDLSIGGRAGLLASAADRFERRLWPIWSRAGEAPENAGPVDAVLFRARLSGPLPGTAKMMGIILRRGMPDEKQTCPEISNADLQNVFMPAQLATLEKVTL